MNCPECGEENTEKDKPNAKTSRLAITSLVLGILSIFALFMVSMGFAVPPSDRYGLFLIINFIAIIVGIVALIKIGKSSGRLKGRVFAIEGIVLSLIACLFMPALDTWPKLEKHLVCATNMRGLAVATRIYADDNDEKLPTADKWCDLLLTYTDVGEKSFRCPEQPEGSFSYALNKNITSLNVAPDTVLFFEADGGKNAAGGPEMLAMGRHRHKGEGCNVVFVDGSALFVRTEDIGSLKWVPKEEE